MAKTHVKPGCHNCADAICDECDDGTRSGRMTGGGPGAGPTIPKVHVSEERAAQGGHVGIILDDAPVIYDIDFETHSGMPLLYPYQREMLRDIMTTTPEFETPVEGDIYKDFVARYAKGDTTAGERRARFNPLMGKPYGGKMRDYMRQHAYFASGDPDPLRSAAGRRFFVLGGGEGNRQLAYYAYGMALSRSADNWVDDVYDRKQRRAEAKLREYCMADVWITADYAAIERRIMFTLLDGYPTVDVTHRLTGPYGWASGQGTGILIEYMSGSDDHPWPTQREADMISGIFVSFGCAPVYAQKAADSLFGCGQYSCIVTVSKLALRNLGFAMEAVGCALTITQHPGAYPEDSNKDIR
jgi:hypothetical protein